MLLTLLAGGAEAGSRGDEGGIWAAEGEDPGRGGEVGGTVGGFFSSLFLYFFFSVN